ncbi:hypothetical protein ORG27_03985 [Stenotrophomonas lactitubi]|jgi:hypothetical protein|uniref:hypothetical protein n=1 Tax=Stenotrophomonas lactitubi TaxID=2045214 RepID=UPI0022497D44|nr:hypothetical protein [Stenotrophomonas lactitubi]MCX2892734.1 hypothetical protein [Stenotrophomonas lactitubi]
MSLLEKLSSLQKQGCSSADLAAFAFRDHSHDANGADEYIVNLVREQVSNSLAISMDSVYVCGSAKYGISLLHGHPFVRGKSDLDLAIVDPKFTEQCLRVAAKASADYSDVSAFPSLIAPGARTPYHVRQKFLEYGRRGVLNFSYLPLCEVRSKVKSLSAQLSDEYRQDFLDVSLMAYSSPGAFLDSQRQRLQQYFARDSSRLASSYPPGYKVEDSRVLNISGHCPAFIHRDVWNALKRVRQVVGLTWCLVVPLGEVDGVDSCFDILICHEEIESVRCEQNVMLWDISSELGRRNILIRFVPRTISPTQAHSMVASHLLSIGKDYGEACLGRRLFLQLVD